MKLCMHFSFNNLKKQKAELGLTWYRHLCAQSTVMFGEGMWHWIASEIILSHNLRVHPENDNPEKFTWWWEGGKTVLCNFNSYPCKVKTTEQYITWKLLFKSYLGQTWVWKFFCLPIPVIHSLFDLHGFVDGILVLEFLVVCCSTCIPNPNLDNVFFVLQVCWA